MKTPQAHTLRKKMLDAYIPLVKGFSDKIAQIDHNNLPEPFLPVYGKGYENAATKILFMGWETRNACQLADFISTFKQNPEDAIHWFEEEFDRFDFLDEWRSRGGKDFWGFILKFLTKFYDIPDWKELYKNYDDYENILNSFAWANCDSIERFEVTAAKKGAAKNDWQQIKDASKNFDDPLLIFDTLQPDIIVLLYWGKEEDWLLSELKINFEEDTEKHLWYYNLSKPKAHLFWTYHPRSLHYKKISFEDTIAKIITTYKRHC